MPLNSRVFLLDLRQGYAVCCQNTYGPAVAAGGPPGMGLFVSQNRDRMLGAMRDYVLKGGQSIGRRDRKVV
jgi:hypothetical protein